MLVVCIYGLKDSQQAEQLLRELAWFFLQAMVEIETIFWPPLVLESVFVFVFVYLRVRYIVATLTSHMHVNISAILFLSW